MYVNFRVAFRTKRYARNIFSFPVVMQTSAFDWINHILYNHFPLLISQHVRIDLWLMKHTRDQIWAPCKQIWLHYDLLHPVPMLFCTWRLFFAGPLSLTESFQASQGHNLLAVQLMPAFPHYDPRHFLPNSIYYTCPPLTHATTSVYSFNSICLSDVLCRKFIIENDYICSVYIHAPTKED